MIITSDKPLNPPPDLTHPIEQLRWIMEQIAEQTGRTVDHPSLDRMKIIMEETAPMNSVKPKYQTAWPKKDDGKGCGCLMDLGIAAAVLALYIVAIYACR